MAQCFTFVDEPPKAVSSPRSDRRYFYSVYSAIKLNQGGFRLLYVHLLNLTFFIFCSFSHSEKISKISHKDLNMSTTELKDNPYVAIVAKKHRNLKKKWVKILFSILFTDHRFVDLRRSLNWKSTLQLEKI